MATKKTARTTKRRTTAKPKTKAPKFERVLVVSAHPDDPEFSAGGSVAKLAKDGAQVTYVIVTDGSQGGEDPKQKDSDLAGIRQKEQRAAAKVLGISRRALYRRLERHHIDDEPARMSARRGLS